MNTAELWTEKYFPHSMQEFIGNSEITKELENWAIDWNKNKAGKPLLLWGQTGVGKTALAHLIAQLNDWQIFELNASDFRTKDIIEKVAGAAIQNASFFGKPRLVLLDEIDGLQGNADKGGVAAIVSVLKEAKNPVILTANDIYADQKLAAVRGICKTLEFKKINYLSIAKFLESICEKEGIDYDQESIKALAKNSAGDMRSALLDLQTLALHDKKITLEDINSLGYRERQEKIFGILGKIFKAKTVAETTSARASSELDSEMLLRWIEENIPRAYHEGIDNAAAFERLSRADIFNGRIRRHQHYGFLRYSSELMTAGVALSRQNDYHEWTMYQFPKLISYLGKTKATRSMRKQIASKIGEQTHSSSKAVISEDWQFLQMIFENQQMAIPLAARFELDEDEISFLMDSSPSTKKVQEVLAKSQELRQSWRLQNRKPLSALAGYELPASVPEAEEKKSEDQKPVVQEEKKQTKLFAF